MTGRNDLLDELRAHIARATTSGHTGPNVLFVTGEAGIGKLSAGDRGNAARAIVQRANIRSRQGETEDALAMYSEALAIFEEIGDEGGVDNALGSIGSMHYHANRYQQALEFHQRSLEKKEERGDLVGQASSLQWIGNVQSCLGDDEAALEYYQRSLSIAETIGSLSAQAYALAASGIIHDKHCDYDAARRQMERALALAEQVGLKELSAQMHGELGRVALSEAESLAGEDQRARVYEGIASLECCVLLLRQMGHGSLPRWEEYLQMVYDAVAQTWPHEADTGMTGEVA